MTIYAHGDRIDRHQTHHGLPHNFINMTRMEPEVVYTERRRPLARKVVKGIAYGVGGLFVLGMIGSIIDPKEDPTPKPAAQVAAPSIPTEYTDPSDVPKPGLSMTPCENEDSKGPCFWDASKSGNNKGRSFFVTADQVVVYLDTGETKKAEPPAPAPTTADPQAYEMPKSVHNVNGVPTYGTVKHGHECVLQTANPHKTYLVVSDTDPMCARWWSNGPTNPPSTPPFDPIAEVAGR